MMRLACCTATEAGIDVCCPVHDAILIEGDSDTIQETVEATQHQLAQASRLVLDGFELDSDSKIFTYPERYHDEDRGLEMWRKVSQLAKGET